MTVLVGYVPTAEGEAAFAAGLEEARRRGEDLVVLNSPRSGALVSADVAAPDGSAELSRPGRGRRASRSRSGRARTTATLADEVLAWPTRSTPR